MVHALDKICSKNFPLPRGQRVPCGESSLWGDYHALELALLVTRLAEGKYYTFF